MSEERRADVASRKAVGSIWGSPTANGRCRSLEGSLCSRIRERSNTIELMSVKTSMASLYQWRHFYQDRKDGRDLIGRAFQTDAGAWTRRTANHLNSTSNLSTTIAVCNQANFVLSPGEKDRVNLVHHGFVHSSSMSGGEPSNAFTFDQGNFVEYSPFKVLPAKDAV